MPKSDDDWYAAFQVLKGVWASKVRLIMIFLYTSAPFVYKSHDVVQTTVSETSGVMRLQRCVDVFEYKI